MQEIKQPNKIIQINSLEELKKFVEEYFKIQWFEFRYILYDHYSHLMKDKINFVRDIIIVQDKLQVKYIPLAIMWAEIWYMPNLDANKGFKLVVKDLGYDLILNYE